MKVNMSANSISAHVAKMVSVNNFVTNTTESVKKEIPKATKQIARQSITPDQDWQKTTSRITKDSKPVMCIAGVVAGQMAYNNAVRNYNKFIEKNGNELSTALVNTGTPLRKCSGSSYIEEMASYTKMNGQKVSFQSQFSIEKTMDMSKFDILGENKQVIFSFSDKIPAPKSQVNMHGQAKAIANASIIYKQQLKEMKKAHASARVNAYKKYEERKIFGKTRTKLKANFVFDNVHRKQKWLMEKLGKKAGKVEKFQKFSIGNLKRLPAALIGVGAHPIRETDAGRGFEVARGMFGAGKTTAKMGFKTSRWIGKEIVKTAVKKVSALKFKITKRELLKQPQFSGKAGKKAFKKAAKKHAERTLKNKFHNGSIRHMFSEKINTKRIDKLNELKANFNPKSTRDALKIGKLQAKIDAKGDKKAARSAIKQLKKSVRGNITNKATRKAKALFLKNSRRRAMLQTVKKLSSKFAGTRLGKAMGFVRKSLGLAGKAMSGIIRLLGHGVATIIGSVFSFVAAVCGLVAHILLFLVAAMAILWLMSELIKLIPNPKELLGDWWAGHKEEAFFEDQMNYLDELHANFVGEIQSTMTAYPAATVIFPDGQQENYREIISAYNVMINSESNQYKDSKETYQEIFSELYEQTHFIKTETFNFTSSDGTTSSGVKVFVEIQRNENLAYSALAGKGTELIGGIDGNCPAGSVVDDDWIGIIKTVKQLIAATGTGYSQETTVPINVNGTTMHVRPDCSGFTSACLQVYGKLSATWSSTQFTFASEIPGFTRYTFSGWENLCMGDIISYNGHVEIFAYNVDGKHYVWNCGSTSSVQNPEATTDNRNNYVTVWRPNAGVSADSTESVDGGSDETSEDELFSELKFDWEPAFPNTDDLFDEDGNEAGYGSYVTSTVQAEMDSDASMFNETNFDITYDNHTLMKEENTAISSYDFIRYVCAQHGVQLPARLYELMANYDYNSVRAITYGEDRMQVGDIIFFQRVRAFDGTMTYNTLRKEIINAQSPDYSGDHTLVELEDQFNSYVPMIYVGDGKFAAYDKDLTLITNMGTSASYNTDFYNSDAKVRLYTFDDTCLRYQRIMMAIRPCGYTKNAIYGAKGSFAGWTNENIRSLYAMTCMDYWTTNEVTYYDFETGEQTTTPFFSSWHEGTFADSISITEGGTYYADTYSYSATDVVTGLEAEIWEIAKTTWDEYGILPSVLITEAMVKSNGRSTEESLKYNNIYEIQVDPDNVFAGEIEEYYYTSPTSASTDIVAYKKYKSVKGAVETHAKSLEAFSFYTSAKFLVNDMRDSNLYTSGEANEILTYIDTHVALQNYDDLIVTRQKYIDDCGVQYFALDDCIKLHGSNTDDYTFYNADRTAIADAITLAQSTLDTLTSYCVTNGLPENDIMSSLADLIGRAQGILDLMNSHKSIEEMPEDEAEEYTVDTIVVSKSPYKYTFTFNNLTGEVKIHTVYTITPTMKTEYDKTGTFSSYTGTAKGETLVWTGKLSSEKTEKEHTVGKITKFSSEPITE
jgi:hypothetical protein